MNIKEKSKSWLIATCFGIVSLGSVYAASAQTLLPEKSTLTFTGKQMGAPFTGQFKKFQAQVQFDPVHLNQSYTHLQIDVTSTSLPSKESETELKGKNWFDTARFPQAKFESTTIKPQSNGYLVLGKLTIKNTTKTVSVPMNAKKRADNTWEFTGKISLNRLDFQLGQGMWADLETVANEVDVHFHFIAK